MSPQGYKAVDIPYALIAEGYTQDRSGLFVPRQYARRRPVAIDLFCGAGGFSLGFIQAGWEVIAGLDYATDCALTYTANLGNYPCQFVWIEPEDEQRMEATIKRENKRREREARKQGKLYVPLTTGSAWLSGHPEATGVSYFFLGDIRKITGQQILDVIGMKWGEVDAVIGGPPCQGFSRAGLQNVYDERNSYVFEFARLVLEIGPKTMVMENVPDIVRMVTPEGVNVVDALCHILADGGFSTYNALKSSLLGHPERKGAMRATQKNAKQAKAEAAIEAGEADHQLAMF
jgi:DNA (cytosine-5)-methyltransferase 1